MQTTRFGRTDLDVSRLTFGCGAVGGLMTRGSAADQDRAVAWARDNGINHFDTAPSYGDTASEINLGRALGTNRDGIFVSTKVGLGPDDLGRVAAAARGSLEASLGRLRQDHVDLFQLHNTIDPSGDPGTITVEQVLDDVVPAFATLRDEGKTRYLGFTAKGDTDDLHRLVESGAFDGAQVFYNMLVPSAGQPIAADYPAQDYRELLLACRRNGVGTIGVRILAGGALSGSTARHPLGIQAVDPIGSGRDYASDAARALRFAPVIESGHAAALPELAVRYAISSDAVSTIEIGIATIEELQKAAAAVDQGPLPADALELIRSIQAGFAED